MTHEDHCTLAPGARPMKSSAYKWAFHNELGGYVYAVESKRVHAVNSSAQMILSLCDGEHTLHDIAAAMQARYPVSIDELIVDVRGFVQYCLEEGFLCLD